MSKMSIFGCNFVFLRFLTNLSKNPKNPKTRKSRISGPPGSPGSGIPGFPGGRVLDKMSKNPIQASPRPLFRNFPESWPYYQSLINSFWPFCDEWRERGMGAHFVTVTICPKVPRSFHPEGLRLPKNRKKPVLGPPGDPFHKVIHGETGPQRPPGGPRRPNFPKFGKFGRIPKESKSQKKSFF